MHETLERPSLRNSWAYQSRLPITAALLILAWVYVALTPPWLPKDSAWNVYADAMAWTAFLGGALLRIWATLWIAGRKKQTVVNDGPYRMCRNPLYVGTFAMGLGLCLFLRSLVFVASFGLVLALYDLFVVPAEEVYMRSRFGGVYDEYCRQAPRWLPRVGRLRGDEILQKSADRGAVYRELLRTACWMVLPILAQITSHLRGTPWWPPLLGPR